MTKKIRKHNYFIIAVPYTQEFEVLASSEKRALKKVKQYIIGNDVSACGLFAHGKPKVKNSWWVSETSL